jgi:hypothetical protein
LKSIFLIFGSLFGLNLGRMSVFIVYAVEMTLARHLKRVLSTRVHHVWIDYEIIARV